ncbi:MAG: NADH-quinone oxidoreductase subunit C, partial [Thermoleophilia bacterium]|nr:NADH-quinone oxidoreductase subunit C [Thermoleophilia bacterium]
MSQPSIAGGLDDAPVVRSLDAGEWRSEIEQIRDDGDRFAGLWASRRGEAIELHAVFTCDERFLLLTCGSPDGYFQSIVDLIPAAGWDEREAHDQYGAEFAGHSPMRPLVDHPDDLAAWTVPVRGGDTFQIAVGPIHAGIIESGHFRMHVVGERILHLDLRLFYKHRGIEQAAEGRRPEDALPFIQRACASDAVANAVAFAQACESAAGLWPTPELRRARTVLLELERLYSHLNDISALCAGVGFAVGTMLFAAFKERAQRLNASLTGSRFLFGSVAVGRGVFVVDASQADAARADLRALRDDVQRAWHELQFADSAQDRFDGVGVLSLDAAKSLGAVGPSARASGLAIDARQQSPRLSYEGFEPAAPPVPAGDVAARLEMRPTELWFTFDRLDELLSQPTVPAGMDTVRSPRRDGLAAVESPRGQTICAVELDDDRVARVHLRTGSYANWPAVADAARDGLLSDFPLINKSFELCYACVDR